jgi:hypothetical protein
MDTSIKIVRQLQPVFEPYRVMFKELKGKKEAAHSSLFPQRKEKH